MRRLISRNSSSALSARWLRFSGVTSSTSRWASIELLGFDFGSTIAEPGCAFLRLEFCITPLPLPLPLGWRDDRRGDCRLWPLLPALGAPGFRISAWDGD